MKRRQNLPQEEWVTLLFAALVLMALFLFSAWHDTLSVLPPLPDNHRTSQDP